MIRPLLRFGSNGPSVTSLQQALNMGDTDLDLLDEDGIFGAFTLGRVKEFQDQEELTPDGIVGPDTHDALEDLYQLFAQLKGPMPAGEDDARQTIVAVAQSALTTFGWANTNGLSQPAQLPLPGAPQIAARFGFGKIDAQGNQARQGGFSLAAEVSFRHLDALG